MEQTAIALITITLLLLVVILMLLTFVIYKLLKKNHMNDDKSPYHPEILERIKEAKKIVPRSSEYFCPNHPEIPGEVMCSVCDHLYCRSCIKPFKSLHFCKEHLPLIMKNEWEEVLTLKTSTDYPEEGVRLYDIKKEIFERNKIPTYIETHYKIDIDGDMIETYLVLYGIKENIDDTKSQFKSFTI